MNFKATEWVSTTPAKGTERDSQEGHIPLPHSACADVPALSSPLLHDTPASVKKVAIAAGVVDAEFFARIDRIESRKDLPVMFKQEKLAELRREIA